MMIRRSFAFGSVLAIGLSLGWFFHARFDATSAIAAPQNPAVQPKQKLGQQVFVKFAQIDKRGRLQRDLDLIPLFHRTEADSEVCGEKRQMPFAKSRPPKLRHDDQRLHADL